MTPLLCLVCVMLMPLAAAGLALIHQGLGRSRSAAHAMLATLCALGDFRNRLCAFGFSWAGLPAGAVAFLHCRRRALGLAGRGAVFPQWPQHRCIRSCRDSSRR